MDKYYKKVGSRYKEVEYPRFGDIDFFEFSFLAEACCGRRPIARAMFFQRVIDNYYFVLTQSERDRLFEWLNRNNSFIFDLDKGEESCLLFNARFDRNNQFLVSTFFGGENKDVEAFLLNDTYYTSKNRFINEDYITKVVKLNN